MTLSSMTGFGTSAGSISRPAGAIEWRWELKSVNGRGLDLKYRLPPGFDRLDGALRGAVQPLGRGSIFAALTVDYPQGASTLRVDENALGAVIHALDMVKLRTECALPQPENILGIKGVLINEDIAADEETKSALSDAVLSGFAEAVEQLKLSRTEEGARLDTVVAAQIDTIQSGSEQARALVGAANTAQFDHLKKQLSQLNTELELSEERLHQEAALLVVKSDISEELDRLDGHARAAKSLLIEDKPIGRKLDFLAQEFMREANTLTTKAATMDIKRIGLELKSVIDQFREQVQNIA